MFTSLKQNAGWRSAHGLGKSVDHALTRISPYAMAALLVCAVSWCAQSAPRTDISVGTLYQVQPGSSIDVSIPVKVAQVNAKEVAYSIFLEDANGNIVYRSGDSMAKHNALSISAIQVDVPKHLPAGHYHLYAEVVYKFNPFKNGTVSVDLGTLQVS